MLDFAMPFLIQTLRVHEPHRRARQEDTEEGGGRAEREERLERSRSGLHDAKHDGRCRCRLWPAVDWQLARRAAAHAAAGIRHAAHHDDAARHDAAWYGARLHVEAYDACTDDHGTSQPPMQKVFVRNLAKRDPDEDGFAR